MPSVSSISRNAFLDYVGHYHADPRLSNSAATEAYVEWAENLVKGSCNDNPVWIAVSGEHIVGFLALKKNSQDEDEIILNAVEPEKQGRGVYAALLNNAICQSASRRRHRIIISTQINNYRVQRVWAKYGFLLERGFYTFQKWF